MVRDSLSHLAYVWYHFCMPIHVRPEQLDRGCRAYTNGSALGAAAHEARVCTTTLRKELVRRGIVIDSSRRKSGASDSTRDEIVRLYEAGVPNKEIAHRLGLSLD